MKSRFLFVLLSVAMMLTCAVKPESASAQMTRTYSASKAVLTNADTAKISLEVDDNAKSVQVVVTRLSGTAAGRAVLKASNDGVNFIAVGPDTLTFSNQVTNTKFWTLSPLLYNQYQVEVITSGTVTASAKGYLLRRLK